MAFLGEYNLLRELGEGAFATVFKVRHIKYGYIRAVRVLKGTITEKSKTYQDFLKECELLLQLGNGNHPNIVHINKPYLRENTAFVEMDYVDGLNLHEYLKQENFHVNVYEVIRLALQISSALAYCHEVDDLNIIHNDIHSGNIMRRKNGDFILLDFGLAIKNNEFVSSRRHDVGAPEFMAPEKWDKKTKLNEQSDIYSFGVVLFLYLAGRVPFPIDTTEENTKALYLLSVAHKEVPPPSIEELRKENFEKKFGKPYQKDYPEWLEKVVLKCLEKNPNGRFKNGKELYNYIREQLIKSSPSIEDFCQLSNEKDALQNDLKKLSDANKNLEDDITNLTDANNDLTKKLTNLTSQYNDAETKISQQKEKLKDKQKKFTVLMIILCLCGCISAYFWYQNIYLKDNNSGEIVFTHDTIYIDKTGGNEQIATLQKDIDSLSSNIKQQKDTILELQQKITQNKTNPIDTKKLNERIAQQNEQIKKDSTKMLALNNIIKQKNEQIINTQKNIADLNNSIKQQKDKISALQKEIERQKGNLTNTKQLNDIIAQYNSRIAKDSTKILALNNQLQQKKTRIAKDSIKMGELQSKLDFKIKETESLLKNCYNNKK